MLEVLPVVNCPYGDDDCALAKLAKIEKFSKWIHLDVADGIFTFNKSWGSPAAWQKLHSPLKLEVHLMFAEPETQVEAWLKAGAKRIVVHAEALEKSGSADFILKKCALHKATPILALNPETTLEMAEPLLALFQDFQVFAQAHPGPAGQPFLINVLPKMKMLRARFPDAIIEVDGGIVPETAAKVHASGADTVVSGSYIFKSDDPKQAYEALKRS